MFNLPENNIHLAAQSTNKQQAIEMVAVALEQSGYVEKGYLQGMLGRELQTSTFLGNGIAIPHGTLETRSLVKETGVQIFQFPQGVEWGEGNVAYVVIGIAARSDEHLVLLRQLTHVLGDEETAAQLATLQDVKKFRAILMGEVTEFSVKAENISLNVDTTSLLTLIAINAGNLQQQNAVDNQFVSEVIASPALPLGKNIWITDSVVGNLKNAITFSRAATVFENNGKSVQGVLTVATKDDLVNPVLIRLLDEQVQAILLNGNEQDISDILNGVKKQTLSPIESIEESKDSVIGSFTIRNEHGLHARPAAVLVNVVKQFNAKVSVENITRVTTAVNAKSLMKVVSLAVLQGHRLRFSAEGDDAQQAIEAIGKAIVEGLGETVSAIPPAQADTIESFVSQNIIENKEENITSDSIEGIFTIKNEHGLHARPAAMLVNEVKKYNASIAVQNLDRESQMVSAKSLMKVVSLGVVKGHRLRFIATGEEAKKAIEGIGAVIESGLGE